MVKKRQDIFQGGIGICLLLGGLHKELTEIHNEPSHDISLF